MDSTVSAFLTLTLLLQAAVRAGKASPVRLSNFYAQPGAPRPVLMGTHLSSAPFEALANGK